MKRIITNVQRVTENKIKKSHFLFEDKNGDFFITTTKHYKEISRKYPNCFYCDILLEPLRVLKVGMKKKKKPTFGSLSRSSLETLPLDCLSIITNFFDDAIDFFSLYKTSKYFSK